MPELTLYTSPRACSLACHIILEESGLPFRVELVRIRQGEHREASYLAINPWGKIPALKIDDQVLTETQAILSYVADAAAGEVELIPCGDALARARAHEWMNFLSSSVHIAFRPLFRPNLLLADEALFPQLREVGMPCLRATLLEVERRLGERTWALGNRFSVVDAYLLVFHIWSQRDDVRPHVADMPNWMAHRQRMDARPATQRALEREGITPDNIRLP